MSVDIIFFLIYNILWCLIMDSKLERFLKKINISEEYYEYFANSKVTKVNVNTSN